MLRRHGSVGVCYGEFEDMDQQPEPAIVVVVDSQGMVSLSQEDRDIYMSPRQLAEAVAGLLIFSSTTRSEFLAMVRKAGA